MGARSAHQVDQMCSHSSCVICSSRSRVGSKGTW
jgi:hypothetical protein